MTDHKVKIRADGRVSERVISLERGVTYDELLSLLGLKPETVVALWEGLPVPTDDVVEPGDLEIVRIVSCG